MSQAYGHPTQENIEKYLEELVELLSQGYLDKVAYGFKRGGEWVVALQYTAAELGTATTDDYSGSIPRRADVTNASWQSYLWKSRSFFALPIAKQAEIEAALPIKRSSAEEPSSRRGWNPDKAYSSGGGGVRRSTLGG